MLGHEIVDEYIKDVSQTDNLQLYLKSVLSNEIKLINYIDVDSNVYKSIVIYYSVDDQGKRSEIKIYLKNKLVFPWKKIKIRETSYDRWI